MTRHDWEHRQCHLLRDRMGISSSTAACDTKFDWGFVVSTITQLFWTVQFNDCYLQSPEHQQSPTEDAGSKNEGATTSPEKISSDNNNPPNSKKVKDGLVEVLAPSVSGWWTGAIWSPSARQNRNPCRHVGGEGKWSMWPRRPCMRPIDQTLRSTCAVHGKSLTARGCWCEDGTPFEYHERLLLDGFSNSSTPLRISSSASVRLLDSRRNILSGGQVGFRPTVMEPRQRIREKQNTWDSFYTISSVWKWLHNLEGMQARIVLVSFDLLRLREREGIDAGDEHNRIMWSVSQATRLTSSSGFFGTFMQRRKPYDAVRRILCVVLEMMTCKNSAN